MRYNFNFLLLVVGAAIGLRLADIDQRVPFLEHRSILTHSFLLPLLLLFMVRKHKPPTDDGLRLFSLGLILASAAHLGFDLFPRGWGGPALIQIPFYGETSPLFSIIWMAVSTLACFYIATLLIRDMSQCLLSAGTLIGIFWFAAIKEPWSAFLVACVLVTALVIALALPPRFTRLDR